MFLSLELDIILVRVVIMGKRTKWLNDIINEVIGTIVRDVFDVQKRESKNGDFVNQVNQGLEEVRIHLTEEEIKSKSKSE